MHQQLFRCSLAWLLLSQATLARTLTQRLTVSVVGIHGATMRSCRGIGTVTRVPISSASTTVTTMSLTSLANRTMSRPTTRCAVFTMKRPPKVGSALIRTQKRTNATRETASTTSSYSKDHSNAIFHGLAVTSLSRTPLTSPQRLCTLLSNSNA